MGTSRDVPPERVIAWLRSPAGEQWSEERTGELECHVWDSGVFVDVIPDSYGEYAAASWPVPLKDDDLDRGQLSW